MVPQRHSRRVIRAWSTVASWPHSRLRQPHPVSLFTLGSLTSHLVGGMMYTRGSSCSDEEDDVLSRIAFAVSTSTQDRQATPASILSRKASHNGPGSTT